MTRKMILIAGVAGIALGTPAMADKGGNGHGGGGGGRAEQAQQQAQPQQRQERQAQPQQQRQERQAQPQRVERQQTQQMQRIERPQRAERQTQRIERPQRAERQMQRIERPQRAERQMQRIERPQRIERQAQRIERPQRNDRPQHIERQQQRIERQAQRDDRRAMPSFDRQQGKADRRMAERAVVNQGGRQVDTRDLRPSAPVFATREMRAMKPFKTKFDNRQIVSIGQRITPSVALAPVPSFYANNYVDTPNYYYRYDDRLGSVYRIERDNGVVNSLIPLFGGYNVGSPWPQTYTSSYVPSGYQSYYYDTPDYYYRNDGYGIYQVDSSTQLISALVALISGQGFGIGQQLPASYDAYNVPLDYRDRYADNADNWYRYGDGYIYQVDPGNRQIEARYPIYADQYAYDVGQPWPVAYPDYNVPYGYQSDYYDTPQYQYRYADGGIYQVNPTTQVIQSLVALLSGGQFAVGQPMPAGYDTYNVPFDYRDRYADSNSDWYRYANDTVYQIDPRTGLIEQAYPV